MTPHSWNTFGDVASRLGLRNEASDAYQKAIQQGGPRVLLQDKIRMQPPHPQEK